MNSTAAVCSRKLLPMVQKSPVIPVLTLHSVATALKLAAALIEGGMCTLEVTLRTPQALEAIKAIKAAHPHVSVGAGTVLTEAQVDAVQAAGADFAVSPGLTPALAEAALAHSLPFLPGVASVSEVMCAREWGFSCLKFFPAGCLGGVNTLKAWQPLFEDVVFVPTGQITADNYCDYLALVNVMAVGGSWVAKPSLIEAEDWSAITYLATQCQMPTLAN